MPRDHGRAPPLLFELDPDQPTTCPECGARTEFETFPSGLQEHVCQNPNCKLTFFGEFPTPR